MTDHTKARAARALLIQNDFVDPHKGLGNWQIRFPRAYIVGTHIWLFKHCAEEWFQQVKCNRGMEVLEYTDAYDYAKGNDNLKHLIL